MKKIVGVSQLEGKLLGILCTIKHDDILVVEDSVSEPCKKLIKDAITYGWKSAIDQELVSIGSTADSFSSAKEALNALLDWHVSVALDRKVSQDAEDLYQQGYNSGYQDACRQFDV